MKVHANVKEEIKMTYAGFWKRVAAYVVDLIIYTSIIMGIALVIGLITSQSFLEQGSNSVKFSVGIGCNLCSIAIWLIYYVWAESSPWQATIGKRLFRMKVVDLNGQRISFWHSLGRNLGMLVSAFTLWIGLLMCLWTKRKQCLHDKMAGCLIVNTTPSKNQKTLTGIVLAAVGLWVILLIYGTWLVVGEFKKKDTAAFAKQVQQEYSQTHKGPAPILLASQYGNVQLVSDLLKEGANVNEISKQGGSPLALAAQNNHIAAMKILLEVGADVNMQLDGGTTALYVASKQGNTKAVQTLLEAKANPNLMTIDGWSPLMIASYNGRIDCVKLLLQAGAQINATNEGGNTALSIASYKGNLSVVKALLKAGADVNLKNLNRQSPLTLAEISKHWDVATALREAGAKE